MNKTINDFDILCVREREHDWGFYMITWHVHSSRCWDKYFRWTVMSGMVQSPCAWLKTGENRKPEFFPSQTGYSRPLRQESQLSFKPVASLDRSPVSAAALTAGHTGTKTWRLMDELSAEKISYSTVFSHLSSPLPNLHQSTLSPYTVVIATCMLFVHELSHSDYHKLIH